MLTLAQAATGRDNNLNLVRLLAATAVLFSHCYPLALGPNHQDPLEQTTGISIGTVAVDLFFVTSGFLVTSSLLARKRLVEFTIARALRIYPALLTVVLASVLAGAALTSLSFSSYFSSQQTFQYLQRNIVMIHGAAYQLPGVFQANPYPGAVNGSLWTLPWELRMYASLGLLWMLLYILGAWRNRVCQLMIVAIACITAASFVSSLLAPGALSSSLEVRNRLVPAFFVGAAYSVLRHRIILSRTAFLAGAFAICCSVFAPGHGIFQAVYFLTMPYMLMCIAYVPGGWIRRFNSFGDYSYGVYLWAFPVQQAIVGALPAIGVAGLLLLAAPVTFVCACCSWHFVERKALDKKALVLHLVQRLSSNARLLTGILRRDS